MMKILSIPALLLCGITDAAAQAAPPTSKPQKAPVSAPLADPRWSPGWVVDVMPRPVKGQTPEVAGRFIAKPEGFAFGDFRKTVPIPGWASFRANGIYDAKHADPKVQRYAFTVIVTSGSEGNINFRTYCQESLTVDGVDIVPVETTKKSWYGQGKFSTSISAGVNLDQNSHEISFTISCTYGQDENSDSDAFFHDYPMVKDVFGKTQVDFRVLTPDDLAPRTPANNELVHPIKATRRP